MARRRSAAPADPRLPSLEEAWQLHLDLSRILEPKPFRNDGSQHPFVFRLWRPDGSCYVPAAESDKATQAAIESGLYNASSIHARNQLMTDKVLENPFPSSPRRPPIVGINVKTPDGRHSFFNFAALYAARHFIDLFGEYRWVDENTIVTEQGVTLRGENARSFNRVFEYEMTKAEREWEIPAPYANLYRQFTKAYDPHEHEGPIKKLPGEHSGRIVNTTGPKQQEPKKPRPSKDGLTTVADIAAQLKIDAKDARKALRSSGEPKPDAGWAWPSTEVQRITKLIKENLK